MKKIITLAVVGLTVAACDFDLRGDEKSASGVKRTTLTGYAAEADTGEGGTQNGPWEDDSGPFEVFGTPSREADGYGRLLMVTTDGLLDGASIQTTVEDCTPAGDWLEVTTVPAGHDTTDGQWFTCYYPSSATADDGASVIIFYSDVAINTGAGSGFMYNGRMVAGLYELGGTFLSKSGDAITVDISATIAEVRLSTTAVDDTVLPSGTADFTADLQNLTAGVTDWAVEAVNADTGAEITGAGVGTLNDLTDTDTVTYTAPATVPPANPADPVSVGGILVTVTATNGDAVLGSGGPWTNSYTIWVSPP